MNTERNEPRTERAVLGIDLGTTYSVVATLDEHGRPRTLLNPRGERLTPSAVFFDEEGVLVGEEAVYASTLDPQLFADTFKRDMGRLRFHRKIGGYDVPPEVLSAFVLRQLRQDAAEQLGPLDKAVITVPAFFDAARRQATQDAGRLAGLDVIDIINEPTAAAVAVGHQQQFLDPSQPQFGVSAARMLVYDLGGGTFDVTVMEVSEGEFRTLATDGDVQLGGKDFDERLVDKIAERFCEAHGIDVRGDPHHAAQLWQDAQEAKHSLTTRKRTKTVCSYGGVSMQLDLDRSEFEELTADLLYRTESTTQQVLRAAELQWSDIDRVVLVGGATRMPMVSEMLARVTGRTPDRSASPDEAVAHGAALYAAMVLNTRQAEGGAETAAEKSPRFVNVNSHSLGVVGIDVATRTRVNRMVIPRNTPLPTSEKKRFVTDRDGQRSVRVRVVEGESRRPQDCVPLGECVIQGLPEDLPRGTRVEVAFQYEPNGRLHVTARIPSIRHSAQVEIDRQESQLLEPLDVWGLRLRYSSAADFEAVFREPEGGDAAEHSRPPTAEGTDLSDPASVLRRLDHLLTEVGRAALESALPAALAPFRESAEQSRQQSEEAAQQARQAEQEKHHAVGGSEAVQANAALAKANAEAAQMQKQFQFSLLILGRECVRREEVPESVAEHEPEIERLRRRLDR